MYDNKQLDNWPAAVRIANTEPPTRHMNAAGFLERVYAQ